MDVKNCTVKKVEHQRIDPHKLWCGRRLLRVPWTAGRSNQSILQETNPGIFIGRTDAKAEAPILWPPEGKSQLIRKDPDARKDGRQEEKGMTEDEWLDYITNSMNMSLSQLLEMVKDREDWRAVVHGVKKSWTQLRDWTTTTIQRLGQNTLKFLIQFQNAKRGNLIGSPFVRRPLMIQTTEWGRWKGTGVKLYR